jgi:hypothetical protein
VFICDAVVARSASASRWHEGLAIHDEALEVNDP